MPITEAINTFFASRNASDGNTIPSPRTVTSVRGVLVRTWHEERRQLKAMLRDRMCIVVYVPSIIAEELEAYRRDCAVADETFTERQDEGAACIFSDGMVMHVYIHPSSFPLKQSSSPTILSAITRLFYT